MLKNTVKVSLIAVLSAVGIALRTVAVPVAYSVQLTPGMVAPILSGILLGLWPGLTTGLVIGVYAAIFSGEFWLIPLIGNLCLGLGPGLVTAIMHKEEKTKFKIGLYLLSSAIIGGFIPTFGVMSLIIPGAVTIAFISGAIDLTNALIASIIAVLIWSMIRGKIREIEIDDNLKF